MPRAEVLPDAPGPAPKPNRAAARPDGSPAPREYSFASATVGTHLRRGLIGFGSLAVAAFLWPTVGWIALAPAALGVLSLRGCPMCWTIGLVQTVTRHRFRRTCTEDGCRLEVSPPPNESTATL